MKNGKNYKIALLLNRDMAGRILHPDDLEFLRIFAETDDPKSLPEVMSEDYMKKAIVGADGCITSWGTLPLTGQVLAAASNLKVLAHAAGTPRAIVTDAVWEKKIRVFTAAPIIAIDVAETVLGLMITSLKRMWQFNTLTGKGLWTGIPEVNFQEDHMRRLNGYLSVGIIGASHVGRNLVKMLKPFGVKIDIYDPYLTELQAAALGVRKTSLEEAVSNKDVVTIHAPNLPQTYHMINKQYLGMMKDETVFINTARGAIVDEAALIDELKTGRLFACIDVCEKEPAEADNMLRTLDNVILTPHISGGHTINGRHELGHYVVQELHNLFFKDSLSVEVTQKTMETIA